MANSTSCNTGDLQGAACDGGGDEQLCVVCFKQVQIYSIGPCDHPVCFECSARMRVVCRRQECPICRGDMAEVVFTKEIKPFKDLQPNPALTDKTQGIYFMNKSLHVEYNRLLAMVCHICLQKFKNFKQLSDHMRREHELFYCDLCVKHLMIFAFERKCYSRSDLALHRRQGDPDNTSHKGHPLCQYCDERYLDTDHLYRHLRRDHLYCHHCDADGKHFFFRSYSDLRAHFREEHFLCEQGSCPQDMLTSVFRTEIDLKAHIAAVHGKQLGRAATRQARTLELEFNFRSRRDRDRDRERTEATDYHGGNRNAFRAAPTPVEETPNPQPPTPAPLSAADFPSLGGNDSSTAGRTSVTFTSKMSRPRLNLEEFPSLGGSSATTAPPTVHTGAIPRTPRNITITKTSAAEPTRPRPASSLGSYNYRQGLALNNQNFPSLHTESSGSGSTVKLTVQPAHVAQPSNVLIHLNHDGAAMSSSIQVRPKSMAEAFPALGGGSTNNTPAAKQWVVPRVKKPQEPKKSKVATAPVLPPPTLADFPSLGRKTEKKSTSVTLPMNNNSSDTNSKPTNKQVNNNADYNSNVNSKKDKNHNQNKKRDNNSGTSKVELREKKAEDTTSSNNAKNKKEYKADTNNSDDKENNLVKKTSTLKIGTLEQPASSKTETINAPPGIAVRPPPGFGFINNDLTFTNSSGQSYSILPNGSELSDFHQPPNFKARNAALVKRFITLLQTPECLDEFKSFSNLFREGFFPASKYYEHCKSVLGDDFDVLFPELLVLLPDIQKQQELYQLHKQFGTLTNLDICKTCSQVIFFNEWKHHLDSHFMNNEYPGLFESSELGACRRK